MEGLVGVKKSQNSDEKSKYKKEVHQLHRLFSGKDSKEVNLLSVREVYTFYVNEIFYTDSKMHEFSFSFNNLFDFQT